MSGSALIRDVSAERLLASMCQVGLDLDLGAISIRVRSGIAPLASAMHRVYADFEFCSKSGFVDAEVEIARKPGLRGLLRPGVRFIADGIEPFDPLPGEMSLPQLEWGVNWCFANISNQHLLLHSGTVEVGGKGMLMVAQPGAGKSTLTAALGLRGARILSDEFGILRLSDRRLLPLPKPVALKNRSIDIIRRWSPDAVIGPTFHKTHKGDVAHLAVPTASVNMRHVPALPRVVLFPRWKEGASLRLTPVSPALAFPRLATNSFNFDILGPDAFDAVCDVTESCMSYDFEYSRLEEAVPFLLEVCARVP